MSEILNELAQILNEIKSYHGTVQAITDYARLMALHDQAEQCLAKLRVGVEDLQDDDDLPCICYGPFEYFD